MAATGAVTASAMPVRAGERRAFRTALLASILLHALLPQALPGWREMQRAPEPAPLLARVVPLPESPSRPLGPPALDPVPPAKSAAPGARRQASKPGQSTGEARVTRDTAEPPAVVASEPSVSPVAATPQSAPLQAVSAIDGGTLAQYRLAVISLAKGFNRYPRIAIENDWQGRVEVRVRVGADGAIASVDLGRGSGHEILDRQALEMIGRAAPQVPLPPALRGREFAFEVPVLFSLREAEG
jgi:protein TonB